MSEKLPIEAVPKNNLPATVQPQQRGTSIFANESAFNMAMKAADFFSNSDMVPPIYRNEDKNGKNNPRSQSNCLVAIEAATQLAISPLTVMQNLSIIEGKPAWDAKFLTAMVNRSGQFSPLRYDLQMSENTVEYVSEVTRWEENRSTGRKEKKTYTNKYNLRPGKCRAYATDLRTGKEVHGAWVTMEMAVKEGWYGKNGSKWQTMPETMLMYRAAAFFQRAYCPDMLLGYLSQDEAEDIAPMIDVTEQPSAPATSGTPEQSAQPRTPDTQEIIPPAQDKPKPAATNKNTFTFKE